MARPLRDEEPGAIYHVTSRGNNGEEIVRDERDRVAFCALLGRAVRRYRWTCQAYCLMTNHYHLVVQLSEAGLSRGFQELNGGFARLINARHGRTGHLFRNRFFSVRIEREGHLLEACRYVVLNPVRAGLCGAPDEWPWSSYRACAGLEFAPDFLDAAALLRLFAQSPTRAQAAYRAFVAAGNVSQCQTPPGEHGRTAAAGR